MFLLVKIEKMRQFHTFEFSFREMLASFYPFLGHSSANSFIFEKIKVPKTKKPIGRGLEGGGGWCSPWTLVLCGCLCNTIILLIQYYCKGSHRGHNTNSPWTLVLCICPCNININIIIIIIIIINIIIINSITIIIIINLLLLLLLLFFFLLLLLHH